MAAMRCPKAFIHGADSALVTPEVVDFMRQRMGPGSPMIEPPEARHQRIVDQPLAFVSTLGALLRPGPARRRETGIVVNSATFEGGERVLPRRPIRRVLTPYPRKP